MKQFLLAASMLLTLAPVAASAADLAAKAPVLVPAASPVTNWTGLYLGLTAGAALNEVESIEGYLASDDYDAHSTAKGTSFVGGGTIGYNWQVKQFVVGAEADFSYSSFSSKTGMYESEVALSSKMDWFGTARLRAGYAFDNVLVYATGGAAFAHVKQKSEWVSDGDVCGVDTEYTSCVDKTQFGLAYGAGVEAMLTSNISFKAEYLRLDLPTIKTTSSRSYNYSWNDSANIIRAGVNYHF